MTEKDLFRKWQRRVRRLKRAHFHAANFFGSCNGWIGGVLILLSASTTTMAYIVLELKLGGAYLIAPPVLAMGTTVLAGLQTYFRFAERAEKHRALGASFSRLELETDSFLRDGLAADSERVTRFIDEWCRHTNGAAIIPRWIYRSHFGRSDGDEVEVAKPSRTDG